MPADRRHTMLTRLSVGAGALAVLATGADHLQQYTANQFSTVPTIGTLFLLNFIAATVIGVGLLLPLGRVTKRLADALHALLAISGVGIAATSLIGLWISESSSLFGFSEHECRRQSPTSSPFALCARSGKTPRLPLLWRRSRPRSRLFSP